MQERARRTRQAIVQAAAVAFEARGYGATRLQDITTGRDVSKGALYFHFPSKESIAVAVLQEHEALWGGIYDELRMRHPRAFRVLIDFFRRAGCTFQDNVVPRAGMRLMLETGLYGPSLHAPIPGWIRRTQDLLDRAREQGDLGPDVAPAEAARLLVATFTGLQQIVLANGGSTHPEHCTTEMWRLLLPGLVRPDRLADVAAFVAAPVMPS